MCLDTFINNVSRYVTVSRYIWNVTVTYLDIFEMYLPQVWQQELLPGRTWPLCRQQRRLFLLKIGSRLQL